MIVIARGQDICNGSTMLPQSSMAGDTPEGDSMLLSLGQKVGQDLATCSEVLAHNLDVDVVDPTGLGQIDRSE